MSSRQLPVVTQLFPTDTEDTVSTVVERDSNGDTKVKILTATTGIVNSGYTKQKVQSKSANFVIDEVAAATTNGTIFLVDSTGGSVTVTLPAVASSTNRVLHFKKLVAANSLILDGASSELIDGAATKTATAIYASYSIFCDGSAWYMISSSGSWS